MINRLTDLFAPLLRAGGAYRREFMARSSKFRRRRIAKYAEKKRMQQPGYSALRAEEEKLKEEARNLIFEGYRQYSREVTALLEDNFLGWLANKISAFMDKVSSEIVDGAPALFRAFPLFSVVAIGFIILLFGWVVVLSTMVLTVVPCALLLLLCRQVVSRQWRKHAIKIEVIGAERREFEKRVLESVSSHVSSKSEVFRGYPPDWLSRRMAVFFRDNYKCQSCRKEYLENELHAHHILEISLGGSNRLENLMTLCAGCHAKEHGRRRKHGFGV